MTAPRSVAVIGLGLVGGSLARDLVAGGIRVIGIDRDPETLSAAGQEGFRVETLRGEGEVKPLAVDTVVLAVPVREAPGILQTLAPRLARGTFVTDVGSTKRTILQSAETLGLGDRFVGSHPVAGDHLSGWTASRRGLFRGARVILCPAPSCRPDAVDRVNGLWNALGAETELLDAAEHDYLFAWSSHLPQAVSTALAGVLAGCGIPPDELGPGGRDTTRLAGSSPSVWTDIALDNAQELEVALGEMEDRVAELRKALRGADEDQVREYFLKGAEWARAASGERSGNRRNPLF